MQRAEMRRFHQCTIVSLLFLCFLVEERPRILFKAILLLQRSQKHSA